MLAVRQKLLFGFVLVAGLGAGAFAWLRSHASIPRDGRSTAEGRLSAATQASPDATPEPGALDAGSDERDPFALDEDASTETPLPGWPGWPLPKGTTVTPAIFCEGATAARRFVRNPKCTVAETRADIERQKRIRFAGIGAVMERARASRCITRLGASVDKKRVRLEPEAGERCVAAAIGAAFDIGPTPIDTAECNGYVIGLQEEGRSCTDPWECVEGLACVGFTRAKDGRCRPLPPLGAACGNGEPERNIPFDIGDRPACARGFVCKPWGGRCLRAKTRGERCEQDWDCLPELACRVHKCASKDRVAAGGECLSLTDCGTTLYCEGTNHSDIPGVCAPKKSAGESCKGDHECKGRCEYDGTTRKKICVAWCQSEGSHP